MHIRLFKLSLSATGSINLSHFALSNGQFFLYISVIRKGNWLIPYHISLVHLQGLSTLSVARMMLRQKSLFRDKVFVAIPEEPRDAKSILSWVMDHTSDGAEIIIIHIVTAPNFG